MAQTEYKVGDIYRVVDRSISVGCTNLQYLFRDNPEAMYIKVLTFNSGGSISTYEILSHDFAVITGRMWEYSTRCCSLQKESPNLVLVGCNMMSTLIALTPEQEKGLPEDIKNLLRVGAISNDLTMTEHGKNMLLGYVFVLYKKDLAMEAGKTIATIRAEEKKSKSK